jgi:anti-anti-sigma factor
MTSLSSACVCPPPALARGDAPLAADQAARPPRIDVTFDEAAGEAVVRLKGKASVPQARAIEAGLLPLSALRPRLVTLDLSEATSLSALAMGVLTAFRRGVVRAGGRVRLAPAPSPEVREALEAAGLAPLFEAEGAAGIP